MSATSLVTPDRYHEAAIEARYVSICMLVGLSLAIYDWILSLDLEIAFIWSQPGGWKSKALFGILRYFGMGLLAYDFAKNSGSWSGQFCHDANYIMGGGGFVLVLALQITLILRIYAIYDRSKKVLLFTIGCMICQMVGMISFVMADVMKAAYIDTPPGLIGCFSSVSIKGNGLTRHMWFFGLGFETYLLSLVVYAGWTRSRRAGHWFWGMMGVLLRSSIIWFVMVFVCSLWGLLAWEFNSQSFISISEPLYYATATTGGCRILLNIQAALNPSRTFEAAVALSDLSRPTDSTDTRGTIGVWRISRPSLSDEEAGFPAYYTSTTQDPRTLRPMRGRQ